MEKRQVGRDDTLSGMFIARTVLTGIVALVLPATGNDTLATLGAGGLTALKSSSIVMESEDLEISVRRISVRYVFRNTGDRDQDVTVAFPLPELGGGLLANSPVEIPSKDPLNFVDFRVLVDGKSITPQVETRAFIEERETGRTEITADLRSMRVPTSPLDPGITAAFRKAPAALQARFEKNGWMDCKLTNDGKCWPMWQVRVQFYWTQRFPARATVEVAHTYSPIVGGSFITPADNGASVAKEYCGGGEMLEQIRKQKALHPPKNADGPVLMERRIQYILTTANNWSGPIRRFRLSVVPDAATDIVGTCLSGLEHTAPSRYELTRTNFRPDTELELVILQPAK